MLLSIVLITFAILVSARPYRASTAEHFTRLADITASYDYIIIGGGTAGLTVADRLTEDGRYTVLVVEYGYFEDAVNPYEFNTKGVPSRLTYNITSVGTKIVSLRIGCCVGGSTAVNSMAFMRGTSEDYDRWDTLSGSPRKWDWDSLLPYFKKSATFNIPPPSLTKDFPVEYDIQVAWGGAGPVQASFPSFQYPAINIMHDAWKTTPGIAFPKDGAEGRAGVVWIPRSVDPSNETRSYARTAHYEPVKSRSNYALLTGHKVVKVGFSSGRRPLTAESVLITPRSGNESARTVTANKEIILAAGAIHSPHVLQRSGVGPRSLLQKANITVVHHLPGVGQNFHDHSYLGVQYNYTTNMFPYPEALSSNATFTSWAEELWAANKTGPYSIVSANLMAQLPLSVIAPYEYTSIASEIESLDPASLLSNGTDATVIAGYAAQLKVMAAAARSNNTAWLQFGLRGLSRMNVNYMHPLSRGSVNINISDPNGAPVVDYRALTNVVDVHMEVLLLKAIRNYFSQQGEIQKLGPVEILPGASVTTDSDLEKYVRDTVTPTQYHPVGTCAKLPLELGGVVDEELMVYGVQKLSIVDASVIPLIVGATLQGTVYAVAEKAADLIKARA